MKLPDVPFLIDIEQPYSEFASLPDQRKARGRRYTLRLLLLLALLAKFAGHHTVEEVAQWATAPAHARPLLNRLGLSHPKLLHAVTYSRVLGQNLDCPTLELILGRYFTDKATSPTIPARGSLIVSIDGKTLRGTIPASQTKGKFAFNQFDNQRGTPNRGAKAIGLRASIEQLTQAGLLRQTQLGWTT